LDDVSRAGLVGSIEGFQVKNNTPNLYIDLTEDLIELLDKRFTQARNME
jgi:hypothetical protein